MASPVLDIQLDKGHAVPDDWSAYRNRYQRLYNTLYKWLEAHKADVNSVLQLSEDDLTVIVNAADNTVLSPPGNITTIRGLFLYIIQEMNVTRQIANSASSTNTTQGIKISQLETAVADLTARIEALEGP